MPDIELRFHKDMLVLSSPVDALLARQGIDASLDREYLNLMEPDTIIDALRLEASVGAQCIVTTTEDITQARLAHVRMDGDTGNLAHAALNIANEVKPQHVLVEIGPCGLPLDEASKASLNENRKQYADAARAFDGGAFDAFFLNGFTKLADLKCAVMGVAQASGKPVFASMTVGQTANERIREAIHRQATKTGAPEESSLPDYLLDGYALLDASTPPPLPTAKRRALPAEQWPEAVDCMVDLGVAVVGFETAEPIDAALGYARTAVDRSSLPVLAQLQVTPTEPASHAKRNLTPLHDITDYTPDTMATAAVKLYGAGVQFLRATGMATPTFSGALAATVSGLDVRRP